MGNTEVKVTSFILFEIGFTVDFLLNIMNFTLIA